MPLPIPVYLENLLVPDCSDHNEFAIQGSIECTCGHTIFGVQFIGEVGDNGAFICAQDLSEHPEAALQEYFPLMVKITCTDCHAIHTLFDKHQHGWNGFVAGEGKGFPFADKLLQTKSCTTCGKNHFNIQTAIHFMGKADFKENAPDLPEEQWVNAFESIQITLVCHDCRHTQNNWLDDECM